MRRKAQQTAAKALAALLALGVLVGLSLAGCTTEGPSAQQSASAHTAAASSAVSQGSEESVITEAANPLSSQVAAIDWDSLPSYDGRPSVEVNGGVPSFTDEDRARGPFKEFSSLDALGRCGAAFMLVTPETLAWEERGSIGMIKPSGWQTIRYDWVDGGYLFNRCHLLGYQLSGENANPLNLITGTRSLNTQGMLPAENRIDYYVETTGASVLLRVTPVFLGEELVARGVLMEAQSAADGGAGLQFCLWCPNAEPGVSIDYATGESTGAAPAAAVAPETAQDATPAPSAVASSYVLNTNTHKFHRPDCTSVGKMKAKNRSDFQGTREEAMALGYDPCKICQP